MADFQVLLSQQTAAAYATNGDPAKARVGSFGDVWASLSKPGFQGITQANAFDIFHLPAAATQATIAQAAAGANKRNVLTELTFTTDAVAAQAMQTVEVLDGAAAIWSCRFGAFGAGLSGIHTVYFPQGLVGTANTAMTIRFTAAPAATNSNSIAGAGFIAG